jgi:cellulose synthase (UDP-forming)
MFAFSESLSNLALSLLIVGAALLLLPFVPPKQPFIRAVLLVGCVLLSWRYLWWRLSETLQPPEFSLESLLSWAYAGLETLTVISATIASLILSRTLDRRTESDRHSTWWYPQAPPRVDIYIATYNEERGILERTIAGAKHGSYDAARIFVLDDGNRWWLKEFCRTRDVGYIARPDNAHAKAGNMNYAFRKRMQDPDPPAFIAVLDADFVPHRNFIERTLALFHDPQVGLVQTPQCFFNPDPIQHNLGIAGAFPDEQRFFFDHVEPSRDAWGIALCCGTSSMVRADALTAIDGFPTESVTEDFLLSLRLSENGWKTVYLGEPLSEGLAPEGLQEYITQRCRWCLGMMQIVRGPYNPFSWRNRLSLRQRISIIDSLLYWTTCFPFRIAALLCPLLYWYFGIIVVDADVADITAYFLPSYVASVLVLNWASRGLFTPVLCDVPQIIGAWPITRAALGGLMPGKPRGFKVTAKGGDRSQTVIQWSFLLPFAVVFALTLGGLCLTLFSDYTHDQEAGEGKIVILGWSLYNLAALALAMGVCFERPRLSHPMRSLPEQAELQMGESSAAAWVFELAADRANVRGPTGLEAGQRVHLSIAGIGSIEAEVGEQTADGCVLRLSPTDAQRAVIFARLHTGAHQPGIAHGDLGGILGGMLRLLLSRIHASTSRKH